MAAVSGRGNPDRPLATEPADLPVAGVLFQRGGTSGTQPRTVTDLYDLYGEYVARSKSTRKPESAEDRQRRLALADATQAISAMLYVRSHTNDAGVRAKITDETVAISKEALEIVRGQDVYNRGLLPWKRREAIRAKEEVAAKQRPRL
jgi:hypothetical protein